MALSPTTLFISVWAHAAVTASRTKRKEIRLTTQGRCTSFIGIITIKATQQPSIIKLVTKLKKNLWPEKRERMDGRSKGGHAD